MTLQPIPDRRPRRNVAGIIAADFIAVALGWFVFNIIRFYSLPLSYTDNLRWWLATPTVLLGQFAIPLCMVLLYALCGNYRRTILPTRSRLDVVLNALGVTAIGALGIFFAVLLNDNVPERLANYELILILALCLFVPVVCVRLVRFTRLGRRWLAGNPTPRKALLFIPPGATVGDVDRISKVALDSGYHFTGFVAPGRDNCALAPLRPCHGTLAEVCDREDIQAIFIPVADLDIMRDRDTMNSLYRLEMPVFVMAVGSGMMAMRRLSAVRTEPMVDIASVNMSPLTANLKRAADIVVSSVALVVLLPVFLTVATAIRLDSPGPVFYRQKRLGLRRKPFNIIKFRTMRPDAESSGPRLSHDNDPRITRIGRFLRKYRLDELPQFWNVLRGQMSIVGPRPERPYFAAHLLEREPAYTLIHHVRPGITSWGMVKYGYASDLDQMMARMPYDLLYIQNISMVIDLKILLHTVATVVTGRGV